MATSTQQCGVDGPMLTAIGSISGYSQKSKLCTKLKTDPFTFYLCEISFSYPPAFLNAILKIKLMHAHRT